MRAADRRAPATAPGRGLPVIVELPRDGAGARRMRDLGGSRVVFPLSPMGEGRVRQSPTPFSFLLAPRALGGGRADSPETGRSAGLPQAQVLLPLGKAPGSAEGPGARFAIARLMPGIWPPMRAFGRLETLAPSPQGMEG